MGPELRREVSSAAAEARGISDSVGERECGGNNNK